MRKVFISYHHKNDQDYKNELLRMNSQHGIFVDRSVRDGDINENLPPQAIRTQIRDNWLRDSTVTILLCGSETRHRKHVDWELKSSMIDGTINKKSGILVINLPNSGSTSWYSVFGTEEKDCIYPDYHGGWSAIETKSDFESRYPKMPDRIIDNLYGAPCKISVVPWDRIVGRPDRLAWLIDRTADARQTNEYDTSRKMRMRDHNLDPSASSLFA